jgi:hypothetical protein
MPLPFSARPPHPFLGRSNRAAHHRPDARPQKSLRNFPLPAQQPHTQPHTQPQSHPPMHPQSHPQSHQQKQPPHPPIQNPIEHFEKINQSLPDGVRYEPMGYTNMSPPHQAPPTATATPTPAEPSHPPGPANSLNPLNPAMPTPFGGLPTKPNALFAPHFERLIQDERNTHVFYKYLSGLNNRKDVVSVLSNLSESAGERVKVYGRLMTSLCGQSFSPEETEINTQLSFEEGIVLAVAEENKALRVLTTLMEQVRDPESMQALQQIFNKKMINRNLLSFIKINHDYPFSIF